MADVGSGRRRRFLRPNAGAAAIPLLPRSYYDGRATWLNTVERGERYRAGDLWGSVGVWVSGRWRTEPSLAYVRAVRGHRRARTWRQGFFRED